MPYLLQLLYPGALWRMDATQKKLYLTFDDGPVPEVTPWVLDLLKQHNIKATFFCIGENVKKHADIYQRLLDEKHTVGNHTYTHPNGWHTPSPEYLENVKQCAALVDTKLFRPPYGRLKRAQLVEIKSKYKIVMWDVLSGDYDTDTTPEKCLLNVLSTTRNGSVVIFHDSIKAQPKLEYALPKFINWALEQGYTFEAL